MKASRVKILRRSLSPHQKFALAEALYRGVPHEDLLQALRPHVDEPTFGEITGYAQSIHNSIADALAAGKPPEVNEKWQKSLEFIKEAPAEDDDVCLIVRRTVAPYMGAKRIVSWKSLTSRLGA